MCFIAAGQHIDQVWMDGDDFKTEGGWIWENTGEKYVIIKYQCTWRVLL